MRTLIESSPRSEGKKSALYGNQRGKSVRGEIFKAGAGLEKPTLIAIGGKGAATLDDVILETPAILLCERRLLCAGGQITSVTRTARALVCLD